MLSIVKNSFITAILFAFLYAFIAGLEMGNTAIYGTSFTDFFLIGLLFAGPVILIGAFLTEGLPRLLFRSTISLTQRIILNQVVALFASIVLYLLVQPHSFSLVPIVFCSGVALMYLLVSESARKYPSFLPYLFGWLGRTVLSFFLFLHLFGSMTMMIPFLSYTEQLVNEQLDAVMLLFFSSIAMADALLAVRFTKRTLPWTTHLLVHQGTVFVLAGAFILFTSLPAVCFTGNVVAAFLYVMVTRLFIVMKTGKEEHHDPSVISTTDE